MSDEDLELSADRILLELSDSDDDDEVRAEMIRQECLEMLRAFPFDAMFDGFSRDESVWILEHSSIKTAKQLRDGIRKIKGELAT